MSETLRIGIDVGGTNTDAVLMDGLCVVAAHKAATSTDVTSGIVSAVESLLAQNAQASQQVASVMIGTTHFANAVVEQRRLAPIAALRLGLPATAGLPPMVGWPSSLRARLGDQVFLCRGGHQYDGSPLTPLDADEIRRAAERIGKAGIESAAITSVFSPVNPDCELEAAELLLKELPSLLISCSHEVGRIKLLERENATLLNASLRPLAAAMSRSIEASLGALDLEAPVYLTQNDGTLMSLGYAERYPVLTFASGPTNSMRGAAFLSGLTECAVVDIGGTTSDIGILQRGFPREARVTVEIGGVPTNLRMPDVLPIGIGGGSVVRTDGELKIGPDSVGYQLTSEGVVFGGTTLTATDLAVAAGRLDLGDASLVRRLAPSTVSQGLALIQSTIATSLDKMKTRAGPIPVVVVGGGSALLPDFLPGWSQVVRPPRAPVANAIGAAIAEVGGEIERVYSLDDLSREAAVEDATNAAIAKATAAGAEPGSVRVVDVEEVALAYLPRTATRIKVRAVGSLNLTKNGGFVAADR